MESSDNQSTSESSKEQPVLCKNGVPAVVCAPLYGAECSGDLSDYKSIDLFGQNNKTLSVLTQRFLDMIKEAPNGVVDLNEAAHGLGVQKRRVYDMTNVMEGIGVIQKESKNSIRWCGWELETDLASDGVPSTSNGNSSCQAQTANSGKRDKAFRIKLEMADLERKEMELDRYITWMKETIKMTTENPSNQRYAYATQSDIAKCFPGMAVMTLQAPPGTSVEVFPPEKVKNQPNYLYTLQARSSNGPILVSLAGPAQISSKSQDSQPLPKAPVPETVTVVACNSLPKSKGETSSTSSASSRKRKINTLLVDVKGNVQPAVESQPQDQPSTSSKVFELPVTVMQPTIDNEDIMPDDTKVPSVFQPMDEFSSLSDGLSEQFMTMDPPLSDNQYFFQLSESEGLMDLFNVDAGDPFKV